MIVFQFLPCLWFLTLFWRIFDHLNWATIISCTFFSVLPSLQSMDSLTEPLTAMNGYLISLLFCGITTKADISFLPFFSWKRICSIPDACSCMKYEDFTLYVYFFKKHCYYFERSCTYKFNQCIYGLLADILHKLWHIDGLCLQSRL